VILINIDDRYPLKPGYYRCVARGFPNLIKCKFVKEKNGPVDGVQIISYMLKINVAPTYYFG